MKPWAFSDFIFSSGFIKWKMMCVVTNVSTQAHKSKMGCERIQRPGKEKKEKTTGYTNVLKQQQQHSVYTASLWDYPEVSNTVQVIKDVVLECSKSILESTAC